MILFEKELGIVGNVSIPISKNNNTKEEKIKSS